MGVEVGGKVELEGGGRGTGEVCGVYILSESA